MQIVSDLHLHSRYSRAVSQNMTLPVMADYAAQKGIDLITASDWTHPVWFKELQAQLTEAGDGIYKLKTTSQSSKPQKDILFLLSTEISSIYTQNGKLRRIHNLVFAPNLETVEKINKAFFQRGFNLMADGRPIIGYSSKNLLELVLSIDERCMLIPCHVWTPHFGIYGSASGFDSLDEAFEELAPQIFAVETGLSSDPEMNWRIKELDNRSIVSFSDAHSPAKMGREATVFMGEGEMKVFSFEDITRALKRKKGKLKIGYTLEFYPEEGKYHFSGHRNCGVVFGPKDIKEKGTMCPVCKRKLTEGVLLRIEQLGNQEVTAVEKLNATHLKWFADPKKLHPPYVKLVPLLEVVAQSLSSTVFSQKTKDSFSMLCRELGSELDILLKVPFLEIEKKGGAKLAEGVSKVRSGTIVIDPGFDGEYGKVAIWKEEKTEKQHGKAPQLTIAF